MGKKNNNKKNQPKQSEDNAVILDYLSLGYINSDMSKFRGKPVAQAIGRDYFTLLELTPKEGIDLGIQDTVYIGKGEKDKIGRLKKLEFENLTATSRIELDYAIRDIVISREDEYINFFNTSGPVNTRLHQLELLPGIGKKYMWEIIEERERKPFESFEDITKIVTSLTDTVGMIVNRVKQEFDTTTVKKGKQKYYLFTPIPNNALNRHQRKK